ncbi:hypothetical protein GW17_00023056 [Ensete ventricosum]|nr:hypothetical protein GW17_00023056 [Ensete ventricosum]
MKRASRGRRLQLPKCFCERLKPPFRIPLNTPLSTLSLPGMERERRVNPDCVNASNPFHVCADIENLNFVVVAAQNGERREGDRGMVVAERNVDPPCRNASNPYHQCAEYCSPRSPQVKELNGEKRSGRAIPFGVNESLDVTVRRLFICCWKERVSTYAGEGFHSICCWEIFSFFSAIPAQNEERCKENRGIVVAERIVDPSCPNESNPFHQCAEYCSPRNPEVKRQKEKRSGIVFFLNYQYFYVSKILEDI